MLVWEGEEERERGEGRGMGDFECPIALRCVQWALKSPIPLPSPLSSLPSSPRLAKKRPNQLAVGADLVRQQEGVVAAVALDVAVAYRPTGGDQGVDDLPRLERREEPVAAEAHQQPAATRPLQSRRPVPPACRRDRTGRWPCSSVR